jgi:SAM-dependent methyltransferase
VTTATAEGADTPWNAGTDGYAARARSYAEEIADLAEPALLRTLLSVGMRVAEVPSATGHFLPIYAAEGCEVVLIDACPAMLARTRRPGLPTPRRVYRRIQDLEPATATAELVVVPNAAFNQFAAQAAPADLLAALLQITAGDGRLLLQVLPCNGDGGVGACRLYDPAVADHTWRIDRQCSSSGGQPFIRHRRQHITGDRLHLDFELISGTALLHSHSVEMRLLTVLELDEALVANHLTRLATVTGADGLTEVLAGHANGTNA